MKFFGILMTMLFLSLGANAKSLTYDEFKESCQNPEDFGHQRPPEKIRLLCRDVFTGWQPIEAGVIELSESRLITSELFSDKYHVSEVDFDVTVPERQVACPRFREVVETATIEVALTCADALADDRTLEEICQDELDEAIASNPDIVDSEPSGRTFSVCGDNTQK